MSCTVLGFGWRNQYENNASTYRIDKFVKLTLSENSCSRMRSAFLPRDLSRWKGDRVWYLGNVSYSFWCNHTWNWSSNMTDRAPPKTGSQIESSSHHYHQNKRTFVQMITVMLLIWCDQTKCVQIPSWREDETDQISTQYCSLTNSWHGGISSGQIGVRIVWP